MAKIKLKCPWCLHEDEYEKKKSISEDPNSKGKSNVSSTIKCNKCNRNLKQK